LWNGCSGRSIGCLEQYIAILQNFEQSQQITAASFFSTPSTFAWCSYGYGSCSTDGPASELRGALSQNRTRPGTTPSCCVCAGPTTSPRHAVAAACPSLVLSFSCKLILPGASLVRGPVTTLHPSCLVSRTPEPPPAAPHANCAPCPSVAPSCIKPLLAFHHGIPLPNAAMVSPSSASQPAHRGVPAAFACEHPARF